MDSIGTFEIKKVIKIPEDEYIQIISSDSDFFQYLKKFNNELINSYSKEEDGSIILTFKNIIDQDDEELSLIKFTHSNELIDDNYVLNLKCDKDYDNEDFFTIDFEDIIININRDGFILVMTYNSKKYPKAVINMIQRYFEEMLDNLEKTYFSK